MLDHFDHEINDVLGGVRTEDGQQRRVRMMLLAGSDLISTMSEPGVWSEEDVSHRSRRDLPSNADSSVLARSYSWEVRLFHG